MECEDLNNDLVVIEDDFIVASVQSPLISLGRLLHRGWGLGPGERASSKVTLISPDGRARVPLQFKRNSLAVCASIRVVSAKDSPAASSSSMPRQSTPAQPKLETVSENAPTLMAIQAVVKPREELLARLWRRMEKRLGNTKHWNPFIIMPASGNYVNPHLVYPRSEWPRSDWPLRSTALQKGDFTWELVEFCEQYYISGNVDSEIEECAKPTWVSRCCTNMRNLSQLLAWLVNKSLSRLEELMVILTPLCSLRSHMSLQKCSETTSQADPRGAGVETAPTFEWEFQNKDTW